MTNQSREESQVRELYHQLLDAWNQRDARSFAALYEEDGNQIGFDGSQVNGQSDINPAVNAIQSLVAVKREDQ